MEILVHVHSVLRWVVLILLLAAIFKSFTGWKSKKEFTTSDKKIALFAFISFHTQVTIGFILYFISAKVAFVEGMMKVTLLRFFAIEHIFGMLVAMTLITLGYVKAKKLTDSQAKFKKIFWFYFIALILVLATIPWPFRAELVSKWF